jgi:hypothetical protein
MKNEFISQNLIIPLQENLGNHFLDLYLKLSSLVSPTVAVSSGLTCLIFLYGTRRAFYHPTVLTMVNYFDPVTLYAFLTQTCGCRAIALEPGSTVNKLIQTFPGGDVENFIKQYGNLLPNNGDGLVEAHHTVSTSQFIWKIARRPAYKTEDNFIDYFIQDAQITSLLQNCNGYYDLGIYNLAVDAAAFGAALVGIPLACYYTSNILLNLATTTGSMITDPISVESLKWWGSAYFSVELIKSLGALSEYAFIMPCKMYNFLTIGLDHCTQTTFLENRWYKGLCSSSRVAAMHQLAIHENILFSHVQAGYNPINPLFLVKTEYLKSVTTGFQSLSMLSNLGWELSSSVASTSLKTGNLDITNPVGAVTNLKALCGR